VPTGVDRVELAYIQRLLLEPIPLYGLIRTSLGYVLLDHKGCAAFEERVVGNVSWGVPDRLSLLVRGLDEPQRVAEAELRRLALARCLPVSLGTMLKKHLPKGVSYLNVGHSNATERVLVTLKQRCNARITILIHDTIPLDFPELQRTGTVEKFRQFVRRTLRLSDQLIANSATTEKDIRRHAGPSQVPPITVAHLGIDAPKPAQPVWPAGFDRTRPYYMIVGTIEPRKGHALLLDVWRNLASSLSVDAMPQLLICGGRGWENKAVFAELDHLGPLQRHVYEMPGLSDGQIAALLLRSKGLLFPSKAEGFGLPPVEAHSLGVPVISTPLPSVREILGDAITYLPIGDPYHWKSYILQELGAAPPPNSAEKKQNLFSPPDWRMHFSKVLPLI
jgi:glycosyltransferase involved in cell wall biosynthesis